LILLGSLRKASINRQLAHLAIELAPPEVDNDFFDRLGELPFYNEDLDTVDVAEPLQALRRAASAALISPVGYLMMCAYCLWG
jgi:NAD(P)H-dependent FMN reductase